MRSWTHKLFEPASLAESVGAQAGALLTGRSIGFLRGVVLAWLLSQREFGLFQVAVAVVNLLVPLSSMGLTHGVLRYAPAHEVSGTLAVFAKRAGVLVILVAAAAAGGLLLAPAGVTDRLFAAGVDGEVHAMSAAGRHAASANLVGTAVLCTFSLVVFHFVVDFMKGLRLFRAASVMDVVGVILFSTLALIAPMVGFDSANAVLLAYGSGNIASVVIFAPGWLRYVRVQPARPDARTTLPLIDTRLIRFSCWMAVSQVAWHALQQYVFWHLAMVRGSAAGAMYFAARLFAQLILLGAQTFSRALSAHVTRVWEATGREAALQRLEAAAKVGFLIVFAGGVAMTWLKPWILKAFPANYALGSSCFDALLLAYAWFGALEFLVIRFHLEEQSVWNFVTSMTGAAANVVLAFVVLGPPGLPADTAVGETLAQAGWVCAAGAGCSVLACLTVLTLTRRRPSVSMLLLVASFAGIAAGRVWAAGLLTLMIVAALARVGLFTPGERVIIAGWCRRRYPRPRSTLK